jgi:Xaa-Pro dipeptidase
MDMIMPKFSLAERERRWRRVRELMATEHLDALVALGNTGAWDMLNANTRYLTGIGGNCSIVSAVFPLEGEVTAVVPQSPGARHWRTVQDWVTDIREPEGLFSVMDAIVERLVDLPEHARRGRIGIAGLSGVMRRPEGIVVHGELERIRAALPQAELVNATRLLETARFVKSDEEIAMLRESVAIVEDAIDVIAREARPGLPECVVYGRALGTMIERGSDTPTFFSWQAGPREGRSRNHWQPTRRAIAVGDVITTEIESSVIGYRGQVTQTFVLGQQSPNYEEMMKIHAEALAHCYDALRPGATPTELAAVAARSSRGEYRCWMIIHGRGLGEDPPILIFRSEATGRRGGENPADWQLAENAALLLRLYVYRGDPFSGGSPESVGWGDSVLVTGGGARRLGTKPPGIVAI